MIAQWIAECITRRRPRAEDASALRLEHTLPLDSRRRICVIRCGGRRLLLLTGGAQDLSLGWLPEEAGCDPSGRAP